MKIINFDWDHGNRDKIKKHGLNSNGIEEFFLRSDPYILADQRHSVEEARFIAFNEYRNRHIYVVFTFRAILGVLKIRVISARYAHKKEVLKFYEKKTNSKNYIEKKGFAEEKT